MVITTLVRVTRPMSNETSLNEPLTANGDSFRACQNPFCKGTGVTGSRKGSRYCSAECRMDAFVMRRASEMIDEAGGVMEFYARLNREEREP